MAIRGEPLYVTYRAWNVQLGDWVSNDEANHALNWVKDGVESPVTAAPSALSNGVYSVLLTVAETACQIGSLNGASTTANVVLFTGADIQFTPQATTSAQQPGGDYLQNLLATRDNIARQLAELTSNPKPSYAIDGQQVDWNTYLKQLTERLDAVNRALQSGEPFEINSIGYTD